MAEHKELEVFRFENGQMAPIPRAEQDKIVRMLISLNKKDPYTPDDYDNKRSPQGKRTFEELGKLANYILESKYKNDLLNCPSLLAFLYRLRENVIYEDKSSSKHGLYTYSCLFENYFNNHNFTNEPSENNIILSGFVNLRVHSIKDKFATLKGDKNKLNELKQLATSVQQKNPHDIYKIITYSIIAEVLLFYYDDIETAEELVKECKQTLVSAPTNTSLLSQSLDYFARISFLLYNAYAVQINTKTKDNYNAITNKIKFIEDNYINWSKKALSEIKITNPPYDNTFDLLDNYINNENWVTVEDLIENNFTGLTINNYQKNYIKRFFDRKKKEFDTKTPLGLTEKEQQSIEAMVESLRYTSPTASIFELLPQTKQKAQEDFVKKLEKEDYSTSFISLAKVIEKRLNIILTMYIDFLDKQADELKLYDDKKEFNKYKNALKSIKKENGIYQTQLGSFYIKITGQDKDMKNLKNIRCKNIFMAFGSYLDCGDQFKQPIITYKLLADLAVFTKYRNELHGQGFLCKADFEEAINKGLFASNSILQNIDMVFGPSIEKFKKDYLKTHSGKQDAQQPLSDEENSNSAAPV